VSAPRRAANGLRFTRLHLENWQDFGSAAVELAQRVFVAGPIASGKSNVPDAFRFLHDIVSVGGGFKEVFVSGAVEGPLDESVLRTIVEQRGGVVHRVQVQNGKQNLRRALPGYNAAAQRDPWLVLVGLDQRQTCARG